MDPFTSSSKKPSADDVSSISDPADQIKLDKLLALDSTHEEEEEEYMGKETDDEAEDDVSDASKTMETLKPGQWRGKGPRLLTPHPLLLLAPFQNPALQFKLDVLYLTLRLQ